MLIAEVIRTRAELLKKNDNPFPRCPACGHRIAKADGDFIIPSFGFIASTDAPGRPGSKGLKRPTTRVYYSEKLMNHCIQNWN